MNKLTKQLLSLGLSAVTVAGMVTPVLADDEVPTTELEATEVTDQPTENVPGNELVMKSITLQITKDGKTSSTSFDVDVNATDDYITSYIVTNCVPEGYVIDGKGAASSLQKVSDTEWQMVLVKKEEQKPEEALQTFKIKVVFSDKTQKIMKIHLNLLVMTHSFISQKILYQKDINMLIPMEQIIMKLQIGIL